MSTQTRRPAASRERAPRCQSRHRVARRRYNDEITDVKYVGAAAEGSEEAPSEGGPQQIAVATNSEQVRRRRMRRSARA